MKNFEDFKEHRLRIDPTTKKFADYQWEQAYAAYRRTRENRASKRENSESPRRRTHMTDGAQASSRLGGLREHIRSQTAYLELRMMVDTLVWAAIGVVVLAGLISIFVSASGGGAISVSLMVMAFLRAALQVIAIFAIRLLVHVLIDIPDIALYRTAIERESRTAGQQDPVEPVQDGD